MKMLLYSIIVLVIQCLGKINVLLFPYEKRWTRPERLCFCEYEDNDDGFGFVSHISCCDCGASHHLWKANKGIYGIPIRPNGYSYRARFGKKDVAFADEKAKGKWNVGR